MIVPFDQFLCYLVTPVPAVKQGASTDKDGSQLSSVPVENSDKHLVLETSLSR